MEFTPADLAQLTTHTAPFKTLPSLIATELSIPLWTSILGPDTYHQRLEAYTTDLLDNLIAGKTRSIRAVSRSRQSHLDALMHLVHSLAHVTSDPYRLKVVGVSLNRNDYSPGKQYRHLSSRAFRRVVSLLTGGDGQSIRHGYQPGAYCRVYKGTFNGCPSVHSGVRTRLEPVGFFKDEMMKAGLVWADHPFRNNPPYDPSAPIVFLDHQPLLRELTEEEKVIPLLNQVSIRTGSGATEENRTRSTSEAILGCAAPQPLSLHPGW